MLGFYREGFGRVSRSCDNADSSERKTFWIVARDTDKPQLIPLIERLPK